MRARGRRIQDAWGVARAAAESAEQKLATMTDRERVRMARGHAEVAVSGVIGVGGAEDGPRARAIAAKRARREGAARPSDAMSDGDE